MKIEKSIPIPSDRSAQGSLPFMHMEVGDSVLCKDIKMQAYAHTYGHASGKKFTTRKQPCGGVRIWRVE